MEYLGKLDLESPDVKQRLGKGKNKTHISLFTGIGGFDIGFAQVGIKTRAMVEFDKGCCETLRHNFLWKYLKKRRHGRHVNKDGTPLKGPAYIGKVNWVEDGDLEFKNKKEMRKALNWYHTPEPVILERDITKLTTKEILEAAKLQVGECSVISGGFPCQGFSLAGKRVKEDPRNFLYKEFVRVVDEAKPAIIIGENVPGIVSMGKGEVMQQICEDFANCGYDIAWKIINCADFGVPQHRIRVILIGQRIDMMRFDGEGRPSYHIAAMPGKIRHPYLFKERIKRWKRKDFLKQLEENPQVEFLEKEEKNGTNKRKN